MADIQPFGDNFGQADPNVGVHTFLGLTVVDFSCTASPGGQGPECTINLIQDPELDQYLEEVVVGSPQYFEIVDLDNNPIFRFYGILSGVTRSVSSNSKIYTAKLEAPTKLLDAVSVITDVYAGYGGAIEAVHPNRAACLDFGHYNSLIDTTKVFNILNAFGVYENDAYGLSGAGFGKSVVNDEGMRIDFYKYAIHELVNGNTAITPVLGSNIIFGADTYDSSTSKAYHYNFDINGFLDPIASYIPNDYRIKGGTLFDFVNDICNLINHDFIIDLLKPSSEGSQYFNGSNHVSQQVPTATHANTIYGGQIRILTQNRNVFSSVKFPLAQTIIAREASDKAGADGQTNDLPLDMGITGSLHPDGPPVASAPFGGEFPSEEINGEQSGEVYSSTNLEVSLNNGTLAKYLVGGYQSRINLISRTQAVVPNPEISGSTCVGTIPVTLNNGSNIMCYWGSIKKRDAAGKVARDIPVITPYLDQNQAMQFLDIIAIDLSDVLGNITIGASNDESHNGAIYEGVYLASVFELRAAMSSFEAWQSFVSMFKNGKVQAVVDYVNEPFNNRFNPIYRSNGALTEYGRKLLNGTFSSVYAYATSSNNAKKDPSCEIEQNAEGFFRVHRKVTISNIMQNIHKKVAEIGQNHYGQSFVVKMPAYALKVDADDEAPLNSYIRSWDIADDAYLDPINYASYEAPQSDLFVNNARIKAYANYDHGFTSYTFNDVTGGTTIISNTNIPLSPLGGQKHYFDFSKYTLDEVVVHSPDGLKDIVSTQCEVNKEYMLIPSNYFTEYGPSACGEWFFSLSSDPKQNLIQTRKMFTNITNPAINGLYYLLNQAGVNDGSVGSSNLEPFALVKVKPVFMNSGANQSDRSPSFSDLVGFLNAKCEASKNKKGKDNTAAPTQQNESLFPMMIMPNSFGIPQQSNRYVYGPWTTNINATYGAKIEYEQISDLVPENYILPANVNLGGSTVTVTSGYSGMNDVGQLIANTVQNFDFLYREGGSVTIPGLPKVQYIGDTLIANGPIVSSVNVNLNSNSIETSYQMSTFAPKFNAANEYILERLKKISNILKK